MHLLNVLQILEAEYRTRAYKQACVIVVHVCPETRRCAECQPAESSASKMMPATVLQVYTSSASVVFDGSNLYDVDEQQPYAKKPMDYYTNTKVSKYGQWLQVGAKFTINVCTQCVHCDSCDLGLSDSRCAFSQRTACFHAPTKAAWGLYT